MPRPRSTMSIPSSSITRRSWPRSSTRPAAGKGSASSCGSRRRRSKAPSSISRPSSAPSPPMPRSLLRAASANGCQVGLAFHVGSQCLVPGAYRDALQDRRRDHGGGPDAAADPRRRRRLPRHLCRQLRPAAGGFHDRDRSGGEGSEAAPRLHSDVRAGPRPGRPCHLNRRPGPAAQGQPALHQ